MGVRTAGAVVLVMLTMAGVVVSWADQWPAPQTREVWSQSRDYFVRVIPGKSIGETVGFRGAPTGPYATAELYRRASDRSYRLAWTVSLVNPVAPIELFVTDRGYLVTLDNWHNMGYGKIVAFYSPDGKLLRSHALDDLFSAAEIDKLPRSVSSIWWRKQVVRSTGSAEPLRVGGRRRPRAHLRNGDRRLPVLRDARRSLPLPQLEWPATVARVRRPSAPALSGPPGQR